MSTLPNPWISASAAVVMSVADQAAASRLSPQASDAAADPFDGADIPMTVLMRRGFDPEQFLADCEPPPLFLQAAELMPVLAVLAGH